MVITYWSDYACPYCYIGEVRLKKAIKELGLENSLNLKMKAFQLNPNASQQSNRDIIARIAYKYGLSLEQAKEQVKQVTQTGRQEGLDFNYEGTLSTNTMDAHRLTKYIASKGDYKLTEQIIDRIFHACFAENLPLADHSVLLQVAMEAGLAQNEIEEILNSDAFRKDVLLDQQEAEQHCINAVPFFIIGNYSIPGAVSVNDFKDIIQQVLLEETQTVQKDGLQCGESGCQFL